MSESLCQDVSNHKVEICWSEEGWFDRCLQTFHQKPVAFHSSLNLDNIQDIERIQKTALRVIFGEDYQDYQSALCQSGLDTLHSRRESRCLNFALKCVKHPLNSRLFPLQQTLVNDLRQTAKFVVNFAKTGTYQKSTIPYCQMLLNEHFSKQ